MRRVIWYDEAVENLDGIKAYVHEFSPVAARRLALRLVAAANSLRDHPERGRAIRRNVRELTIVPPYLIRYRVEDDRVLILRIRHGARKPS